MSRRSRLDFRDVGDNVDSFMAVQFEYVFPVYSCSNAVHRASFEVMEWLMDFERRRSV